MKRKLLIILSTLLLLTACTTATVTEQPELSLDMIAVKIEAEPQRLMPGEPVVIKATVTLHDEVVEADKVIFEIWKDGDQANSENIEATRDDIGVYSVTKTFDEGVYYAVSHVDYGIMHNMPRLKLVVGDVPGEDPHQEQEEHDGDMSRMNMN